MKNAHKITLAAVIILGGLILLPHISQAAFDIKKGIIGNLASDACRESGNCGWCDFIDLMVILQKIILSLFGTLAMAMLIWGGFGIAGAAGNQEKFTAGKKLITSTLLGVGIILFAYFLINIIFGAIATPSGQKPTVLFTQDWWKNTLHCYTPQDGNDFCKTVSNGTTCYLKNGDPGRCKNENNTFLCTAACGYVHPETGWDCKDISTCTTAHNLNECDTSKDCERNLCGGGDTNVCCK